MKKNNQIHISIIIVSWNTCQTTCNCINSIYEYTKNLLFEIIVVDNNSSDDTVKTIQKDFPHVKIINNSENLGFGCANNQGMDISNGDYLLLLNSDTILTEDSLSKIYLFAKENPNAGVIGCKILNPDNTLQHSCVNYPRLKDKLFFALGLSYCFPKSKVFNHERMQWWKHNKVCEVEAITGCFMLVKKQIFEETGGFDERFFMYCEEIDWCKRITNSGWKIIFTPCTHIIHYGGVSALKHDSKRSLLIDKSYVKYMFKHWGSSNAKTGILFMLIFYIIRIFLLAPLFPFKKFNNSLRNHWVGFRGLLNYKDYLQGN